jgi:membrane protease YdiL (CAAX protease family)
MNSSEMSATWSTLAAFALTIALLISWVALGAGLAIVINWLVSGPSGRLPPATLAIASMIASGLIAGLTTYLIWIRADRSQVFAAPRGGVVTLIAVPLVFAASVYAHQVAKAALETRPQAPSGRSVTDGEVALLVSDDRWLLIVSAVMFAPIVEELMLRGLLLPGLTRSRLRFAGAAIVSTLLFVALHPGGLSKFAGFAVLLDWHLIMGLGLCVTWWFSRSIWPCILGHAAANLMLVGMALRMLK